MTTEEKIRWLAEQAGWLTPDALDREHWRWRGMRRQKGGWDQELWVALYGHRKNVCDFHAWGGHESAFSMLARTLVPAPEEGHAV